MVRTLTYDKKMIIHSVLLRNHSFSREFWTYCFAITQIYNADFVFYGIVLNWLLNDFLFPEMFIHHEIIRINCWIFFFFFTIHKIIPQLFFNESIVKVFIIGNLWLLKDVTYIQLHCTCKVDLFKLIIEMISLCLTQNTKGLSGPFF